MQRPLFFIVLTMSLSVLTINAWALDFQMLKQKKSTEQTNASKKSIPDPETYERGLTVFQDDVLPNQNVKSITLTPAQKHQAQVWGLTPLQEKRYVILMQNRSGLYWHQMHLSPPEILGVNARNPRERRFYARLYAKQLNARIAKELAWQVAASRAKAALNRGRPLVRPFDVTPFNPYHQTPLTLQPNDALFLLTQPKLNVRRLIATVLSQLKLHPTARFNIYFSGKVSASQIQHWAAKENIPVSLVKSKRITLNTHLGPFAKWPASSSVPQLILVRAGLARRLDLSRF